MTETFHTPEIILDTYAKLVTHICLVHPRLALVRHLSVCGILRIEITLAV